VLIGIPIRFAFAGGTHDRTPEKKTRASLVAVKLKQQVGNNPSQACWKASNGLILSNYTRDKFGAFGPYQETRLQEGISGKSRLSHLAYKQSGRPKGTATLVLGNFLD
jgi:hypothetical protein